MDENMVTLVYPYRPVNSIFYVIISDIYKIEYTEIVFFLFSIEFNTFSIMHEFPLQIYFFFINNILLNNRCLLCLLWGSVCFFKFWSLCFLIVYIFFTKYLKKFKNHASIIHLTININVNNKYVCIK